MPTDKLDRPLIRQRLPTPRIPALLQRIEREYQEMPGLTLTRAQAQRLWDLDPATCRAVMGALTERGVLRRTPSGRYVRASD
jgi:predicted transcriptional regulator of viral defense system